MNIKDIDKFPPGIPWKKFSNEELSRLIGGVIFGPGGTIAFGIKISSRYNESQEIKDMIHFASEVARAGLTWAIKRIFYDSKVSLCSIEFTEGDSEEYCHLYKYEQLREIADHTLYQHDLFDSTGGYCHNPAYIENEEGASLVPAPKRAKRVVWYHSAGGNS